MRMGSVVGEQQQAGSQKNRRNSNRFDGCTGLLEIENEIGIGNHRDREFAGSQELQLERATSEKFDILFGQSVKVAHGPLLSHMLEQKSHPLESFRVQGELALPFR